MSEEDLALIKLGKLGTIATLCADTAGNVGVRRKFRKFLPAPQEGQTLPPTYNLQTMEEGCEVISTDNSRTQVTELKGKLMGFYGTIYSEQPEGRQALPLGPHGERLFLPVDANGRRE